MSMVPLAATILVQECLHVCSVGLRSSRVKFIITGSVKSQSLQALRARIIIRNSFINFGSD